MENRIRNFVKEKINQDYYERFLYSIEGGKRIRPLFMRIICEKFNKDFSRIFPAAVAVEIMHTSTLLHDDVIDREVERRGKRPFYQKFNREQSIIFGDYFASVSLDLFFEQNYPNELTHEFIKTIKSMVEGQIMEVSGEVKGMKSYMTYIEKKTASLFLLAARIPFVVFGLDSNILEFSKEFGIAFQIANDLKGRRENSILEFISREDAESLLDKKIQNLQSMNILDVRQFLEYKPITS